MAEPSPVQGGNEEIEVHEQVPIAPLTTIGIGGPARFFVTADSPLQIGLAVRWARQQRVPLLVLGGGSNLLCSDAGFPGLVVHNRIKGLSLHTESDGTELLTAGGGENWDDVVDFAVQHDLQGIECLSGIPGSVGACPVQNIGAYGQEVKDTLLDLNALDRESGEARRFTNTECQFGYRMSRFKRSDRDRYIITEVRFRLHPGGKSSLRYGDLTRYFGEGNSAAPSLKEVRAAVLSIRARKAMVLDPAEPDSRSCGSFFMNPIVSEEQYHHVVQVIKDSSMLPAGDTMPVYDAENNHKKLSAAWLMERAGCRRGERHGNVGLSSKHVLAIVNRGSGTAKEVMELMTSVQSRVFEVFGVTLEPEPVITNTL